jgi:hypothetical protein
MDIVEICGDANREEYSSIVKIGTENKFRGIPFPVDILTLHIFPS